MPLTPDDMRKRLRPGDDERFEELVAAIESSIEEGWKPGSWVRFEVGRRETLEQWFHKDLEQRIVEYFEKSGWIAKFSWTQNADFISKPSDKLSIAVKEPTHK